MQEMIWIYINPTTIFTKYGMCKLAIESQDQVDVGWENEVFVSMHVMSFL
jgi:hypothetical protein